MECYFMKTDGFGEISDYVNLNFKNKIKDGAKHHG